MKKRRMPPVHDAHPNVTPLIDIVMCLIVFFMLVAKIGVSTGAEAMIIPATLTGTDIRNLGNTLTLNVRAGAGDDPYITALVGTVKEELGVRGAPGRKLLADLLKTYRFGPDRKQGGGDDNPSFSIVIRAEENLQYRFLEPVLTAAAEASVSQVSFNTRKVTVQVPVNR
jgi:biopolymer transport protein ExbD